MSSLVTFVLKNILKNHNLIHVNFDVKLKKNEVVKGYMTILVLHCLVY